jgi:uncharacterized protein
MQKNSKRKQMDKSRNKTRSHSRNRLWHSLASWLSVKRTKTGLGLFTTIPIQKNDFIIEYRGKKISSEEANIHTGKYLFDINDKWTIDGANRSNIARYINHSCKPNCEAEIKQGRIAILARKNIKAGEELTYDYGKDYFDIFIKPHGCKCEKCREK